eukprot:TRINITY_DN26111_c0_g1_i1.p1 TRINITY_DN26111_c0_g1~~TRINITY_DN26111_c0_g1_i1.p1  ORF type:complete len:367 (+),score=46.10 TRINITY_DN26111_c0_g1_i1:62-1162(+)
MPKQQKSQPKQAAAIADVVSSDLQLEDLEAVGGANWVTRCVCRPCDPDGQGEDRWFNAWLREAGDPGPTVGMWCVLDGHGGHDSAELAVSRLPQLLLSALARGGGMQVALDGIFASLEDELERTNSLSGTCANLCMLVGPSIWCANLGDCRACYVDLRTNKLTWLSEDHQGDLPSERARVERAGFSITGGRLGGILEPTRTLGDFDVKRSMPGAVSSSPTHRLLDLRLMPPTAGEGQTRGVVIIGSDGLWRHHSEETASKAVQMSSRLLMQTSDLDDKAMTEAADDIISELLKPTDFSDDTTVFVAVVDAYWRPSQSPWNLEDQNTKSETRWTLEAVVATLDGKEIELWPAEDDALDQAAASQLIQ